MHRDNWIPNGKGRSQNLCKVLKTFLTFCNFHLSVVIFCCQVHWLQSGSYKWNTNKEARVNQTHNVHENREWCSKIYCTTYNLLANISPCFNDSSSIPGLDGSTRGKPPRENIKYKIEERERKKGKNVVFSYRRTITGQWWRKRGNSCQMYRTRNHWPHTYDWYFPDGNLHTFCQSFRLLGSSASFLGNTQIRPLFCPIGVVGYIIKYLKPKTLNDFLRYDKTNFGEFELSTWTKVALITVVKRF